MRKKFSRRVARRAMAFSFAAAAVAATPVAQMSATANPFSIAQNPRHTLAVHDFGGEHAHLADSLYDRVNPLILAALPRGKSHVEYRAPSKCIPGGSAQRDCPCFGKIWSGHRQFHLPFARQQPQRRWQGQVDAPVLPRCGFPR